LEERLQLAVFIDFDNIEIGVKSTLNTELDLSLILDSLKERGEVVSKSAYGDWARAGMHSRTLTENAVHMVQRNVTPRGDKNGADINLVVDALEMAFTRPHISGFAIVGGDSDFIALVEKLKQFGKRVFVVGGRSFTSGILQRNCHEFISYENLLSATRSGRQQQQSRGQPSGRLSLQQGFAQVQRALKILADRGVEPQLGPLKSTLLQLDSTFSERDYGASSFREFIQRLDDGKYLHLRRIDQGYLVEMNGESTREPAQPAGSTRGRHPARASLETPVVESNGHEVVAPPGELAVESTDGEPRAGRTQEHALALIRAALERLAESRSGKPIYVRHLAQGIRAIDPDFDEQTYGFRTLTELMYLGQREGVLRMQRDRQGAWRISPITPSAAEPARERTDVPAEPGGDEIGREESYDQDRGVATPAESGAEGAAAIDAGAAAHGERQAEIPPLIDPEAELLDSPDEGFSGSFATDRPIADEDLPSPAEAASGELDADAADVEAPVESEAAGTSSTKKPRSRRRRTGATGGDDAKPARPRTRSTGSRGGSSRRKTPKA
jgi:uncharacterized LabA/DUF88 family protein